MVKEYKDVKTGKSVAIKTVNLETSNIDPEYYNELYILDTLRGKHQSILQIIDAQIDENIVTIITEVAPGVELVERMCTKNSLRIPQIKKVFIQLLSAMEIAHSYNIIHRDLKPDNIIIDDEGVEMSVKIIDWGLAIEGTSLEPSGSPVYAAPEIIKKPIVVGPWNDVWSLGVILFAMLTHKTPFGNHCNISCLFKRICSMDVDYNTFGLSSGSIGILQKIFVPYWQRETCTSLLKDEWLFSNDN